MMILNRVGYQYRVCDRHVILNAVTAKNSNDLYEYSRAEYGTLR